MQSMPNKGGLGAPPRKILKIRLSYIESESIFRSYPVLKFEESNVSTINLQIAN